MRTLIYDPQRELSVVENEELRRYELLLEGTTAGTLDFRVLGEQRVLGHTEVTAAHRGRGLGTALIQAVLDDLIAEEVRITNYCPAVERFLQGHPTYLVVLDPSHPAIRPRSRSAPLQQLVHAQHSSLRELAARAQDPEVDGFARRRVLDQFTAVAAQHAAAVADVLLPASKAASDVDTAVLVDNLKRFEQALRVLKGRAYGDARFLNLSIAETWRDAERLLAEHEAFEVDVVAGLERLHSTDGTDEAGAVDVARSLAKRQWSSATRPHPNSPHSGLAGRIARRLWRIADSTWDELEGRGLPTQPIEHPNEHSPLTHYVLGTVDDAAATTPDSDRKDPDASDH